MNLFLRRPAKTPLRRLARPAGLCVSLSLLLACLPAARAQTPPQRPAPEDPVERVTSELVQTDVTVVDKDGRFVDDLKAEQFELKVDGKPTPVAFFERVAAGSAQEPGQLSAARSAAGSAPARPGAQPRGVGHSRTVFFFVDDFHLDSESFIRARRALLRAIETELGPDDRASVVTAGGVSAPPPLTSDKAVLKAAAQSMGQRHGLHRDHDRPPMSEIQALSVHRNDQQIIDYYADYLLSQKMELSREAAVGAVKDRALRILEASAPLAAATLDALNQVVHAAAQSPGRKLVFFVSDGFLVESDRANSYANLRRVTDAAARAGVLVYTLNARGLASNSPDASAPGTSRPSAADRVGDDSAQDVLYTLAADTGGRALVNSNDLNAGVRRALQETAVYYLLAWSPPKETRADTRFKRVEVSIAGRPDLKVLTRNNLAAAAATARAGGRVAPGGSAPGVEHLDYLRGLVVTNAPLPTTYVITYRDAPAGPPNYYLTISVQVPRSALPPPAPPGQRQVGASLAAAVLDKDGKALYRSAAAAANLAGETSPQVYFNFVAELPPGRYEVQAGALERTTGRVSYSSQWVELPDLSRGQFALSSLLLAEQTDEGETPNSPKGVARRFGQHSRLRFLAYAYNAAPDPANGNTPDLDLKLQITRDGKPVEVPPLVEVLVEGEDESKRFPVAAEIPLDDFPPGDYTLQMTVTDRLKKATATQQTTFAVVD